MSLLRYCFPTFFRAGDWAGAHFTSGGLAALLAMAACLPVVIYAETPLFHIFSALASLLMVAGVIGYLFQPRLTPQTKAPRAVHCDQPVRLDLTLANRTWAPVFDLQVSLRAHEHDVWQVPEQSCYIPAIGIHQAGQVWLPVTPKRRGVFAWPRLEVASTFPLNLMIRRRQFVIPGELVVYPHYEPAAAQDILDGHDTGDAQEWDNPSIMAGTQIYSGNREYVPGMYVRRWDYSSWARTGKPIVREISDPPQSAACLLVDTALPRTTSPRWRESFEAMLSLAAGLADRLLSEEWTIQTFVAGPVKLATAAGSASIVLEDMLEALARAHPASDAEFQKFCELATSEIDIHCVTYLLLTGWDARREALCRTLEQSHADWKGILIQDGPADLPGNLAGLIRCVSPDQFRRGD